MDCQLLRPKILSNALSNESKKACVSRKIVCFGIEDQFSVYVFITYRDFTFIDDIYLNVWSKKFSFKNHSYSGCTAKKLGTQRTV